LDKLHAMAEALIKYETIDSEQIDDIMAGRPPRDPKDWDSGESKPPPSDGAKVVDLGKDASSGGKIGGPAAEH
jgi:cell division protease FtsH